MNKENLDKFANMVKEEKFLDRVVGQPLDPVMESAMTHWEEDSQVGVLARGFLSALMQIISKAIERQSPAEAEFPWQR